MPTADLSTVLPPWAADFVKGVESVSHDALFSLLAAANELEIPLLEQLACAQIAASLRGKNAQEMRSYFAIESDFTTPEETELM